MEKVYVVSTGSYSDWSISGIFKNKEKAEHYASLIDDANDVEEHVLSDDEIITPIYIVECSYETKNVPYSIPTTGWDAGWNMLYKTKGEFEFNIEKTNSKDESGCDWRQHHTDYSDGTIYLYRTIRDYPKNDFEYENLRDKYYKVCTDFAAIIEYEESNGATVEEIAALLSKKED